MRWVTIADGDTTRVGLCEDDTVYVLADVTNLLALLGDDGERLAAAGERARRDPLAVLALERTDLLAPITMPPSIRDFMAFEEHFRNAMFRIGRSMDPVWNENPVFYFGNPASVHGPFDDVAISPGSQEFDFEAEIGAVVGLGGSDLSPDEAERHIAGYFVLCDWSARDLQGRDARLRMGPGKGKDSATSFGPLLVTPDELEPYRSGNGFDRAITVHVNGQQYTAGNWNSISWSFADLLAFGSRGTRLVPGDVLGSGTVGRGSIYELSALYGAQRFPWLAAGDEVSVAVAGLGEVRARIRPSRPLIPLRSPAVEADAADSPFPVARER
jgi:2-keto-4-pentenoate hydratase/2-oxohepta-3-ene-1,7-dioic acid hydratase in catechol pathway